MGVDKEKVKMEYLAGVTPKELSKRHGISINTIKSWMKRYKWSESKGAGCTPSAPEGAPSKQGTKIEKISDDIEKVSKNADLNEKQKLFCLYYIRSFNATKAYQKAYGCTYETAGRNGHELLKKTKIIEEIQRLKQNKMNRELLSEEDIFQKYIDIAFADITDYVEFDGNTVRLKKSDLVDGTLISEVKKGRDGTSVKLSDRMKALQWLSDHMNLATEEQKARIKSLNAKTSNEGQLTAEDKVAKLFEAIGGALDAELE